MTAAPNAPDHDAPDHGAAMSYARGEPVALGEVERVLSSLWRQAGGDASEDRATALTRSCLWNLVVYQSPQLDEAGEQALDAALMDISPAVPSRILRLAGRPEEEKPAGGGEVGCWVSTLCNIAPGGGKQVSVEEIRLVTYGDGGGFHFPALVRAFLVPDLPVALVWLGSLPRKGRLLGQLLPLCDRILIDTQSASDEQALTDVESLEAETHAYFIDLGWMRLNPVRYLLAGLFDPPGAADKLQRVDSLRVEVGPRGRNTGLLTLGWLLSRLGHPELKVAETTSAEGEWSWNVRLEQGSFPVGFAVREGEGGLDGLLAVEIRAGGELFALYQVDALHVSLESPHRKEQRLALHGWNDPELLIAGLGGAGIDPLYPEALGVAARLIAAQTWNR